MVLVARCAAPIHVALARAGGFDADHRYLMGIWPDASSVQRSHAPGPNRMKPIIWAHQKLCRGLLLTSRII